MRQFGRIAAITTVGALVARPGLPQTHPKMEVPSFYKTTRDQVGHEFVKTEQFVVSVGTQVVIKGLDFGTPACALDAMQKRILAQVFNSLEEITENTDNDTDLERVARFKKMKFEVRGNSWVAGEPQKNSALAKQCADVVMNYILGLGTPPEHLSTAGRARTLLPGAKTPRRPWTVEFFRTQ